MDEWYGLPKTLRWPISFSSEVTCQICTEPNAKPSLLFSIHECAAGVHSKTGRGEVFRFSLVPLVTFPFSFLSNL